MLIKIIKCRVGEDSKDLFHHAQTKWTELKKVTGFIAQVGGWNLENSNEAIIIGFWESRKDYISFMSETHDKILDVNKQSTSYENIEVCIWMTENVLNSKEIINSEYLLFIDGKSDRLNISVKDSIMLELKNEEDKKILVLCKTINEKVIMKHIKTLIKLNKDWTV